MPLPKSLFCVSCKHTYPEGWRRCPYCGFNPLEARRIAAARAPTPQPQQPDEPRGRGGPRGDQRRFQASPRPIDGVTVSVKSSRESAARSPTAAITSVAVRPPRRPRPSPGRRKRPPSSRLRDRGVADAFAADGGGEVVVAHHRLPR